MWLALHYYLRAALKGENMMAVFLIEKTRDYTMIFNHHLRNTGLSLKFPKCFP